MSAQRVQIRRARRTDFVAVMQLLAAGAAAVPPPDRATLRRFRYLVADLGGDFYLASVDGTLAGLVHVTYARQLAAPPAARLEQLVVAPPFRRCGVGVALIALAAQRARARGCAALRCVLPVGSPAAGFLERAGWRPLGQGWVVDLAVADA